MGSSSTSQFGDTTTLTKVFVGGLAWETPTETMREHFEKFGEILEAVIISDKVTGRSKGYGFVTFKEPEAAKKACEDATPIINGRRANCNLASLGGRRVYRSASATPPPQQGSNVSSAPANHLQWYYAVGTPAIPFHHQHHHQAVPFYGYSPSSHIAAASSDVRYNQHKLSYTGGSYVNRHLSPMYAGQPIMGANTLMPMYPLYHFHQSQKMGGPAPIFPQTTAGSMTTGPVIMSKPASITPRKGTVY